MKITRRFTRDLPAGQDVFSTVEWSKRTSKISNPDGSVVFEMTDAEIPASWSQLATDIMVSKYFRKAGVPQMDTDGRPLTHEDGTPITGPERSARQVIGRLAGCWRHWGQTHGYFDSPEDAQAFHDELCHMMLHQMSAPNSPQWFNTGLHWAYGITGPAQGHFYCDPESGELKKSANAYEHPQPHACFIQSVEDDLVNAGGIMDLWTREARLFKYGSGTGTNFSRVRGEDESLSGGGKSSGLMSFLKIGDRAAGAIKSGGTTRRAAKMVCLDLDHPDIESFVNWKVREELKVAAMVEGLRHLPGDQKETAQKLGLKLDFDFNGEAYATVSGQNSNNSVRIPNAFFEALENDADWTLYRRTDGEVAGTVKARDLWDQIAYAAWRSADPGVQFDSTINQWHTCPAGGRINASNPCVTGDTRVLTPGGIWRRIDQMIHLPSRVVTNLGGQEIHVTDGAFPTGQRDVYQLHTESGYALKLTADHKVWTRRRGWVEAQHLTRDDEVRLVAEPAAVSRVGEPTDAKLFQLVGLFISEANGDPTAVDLDDCLDEQDLRDSFADYIAGHWPERKKKPARRRQLVTAGGEIEVEAAELAEETAETAGSAVFADNRMVARLRAFLRCGADGRLRLSDDAFTAGLAAQKHLLRGLFTADGEVAGGAVELRNDSPGLLGDVQTILLGFGIKSRLLGGTATEPGDVSAARRPALGLRVEPSSLHAFAAHVALLPGAKLDDLADAVGRCGPQARDHWDRVEGLDHLGYQQVFDLTEPETESFVANGVTVHNCSEYMFLDDTACNLASLNVLKFYDARSRRFDAESFKHAARIWTVVLEISVLMASFPSEAIAELSYKYRTLGLGYANLGAMLMQAGIPYDSEEGRAICGVLTAVLTGESYATSAEMAGELGAFAGYADNAEHMLRVIRNHRRAAYDVANDLGQKDLGDYEALDIAPVGIDALQFGGQHPLLVRPLLDAARDAWDRALAGGEEHGFRNAQATVIAPTGTIGLLMDCDTTGVEPDFALVKFKKLAGGGYFKIANQSLRPALLSLGYTDEQAKDVIRSVMGTLTLGGAPHVNRDTLLAKGFTDDDLDAVEKALPGTFELKFAFSPWSLKPETLDRLGVTDAHKADPSFGLLRHLGFTRQQIDEANDVVCGRGTVEGAPHLRDEHLPVFDCANKCGRHGERFIAARGHITMMAAAQPFISGAISKTINLPHEAGVEEIKECYDLSWRLALKANALYRDGSKLSQPLNIKSDDEIGDADEDEDNAQAAVEETAEQVRRAAALVDAPEAQREIIKIVERVVNKPMRRRLPDTRRALTHKFDVAGHEGYITVGTYDDGAPGEMFVTMSKEGSTIGGLMDTIATLVSVSLQYGVPLESLVRKFEHVRFEPSGMTRNRDIPMAKSLVDYIFRWLAMEFIGGYKARHAPVREDRAQKTEDRPEAAGPDPRPANGNGSNGNGHKSAASPKPFAYAKDDALPASPANSPTSPMAAVAAPAVVPRVNRLDALSQQGADMQSDAPACDTCGSITVRSGTCYKCLNCGASMGCS